MAAHVDILDQPEPLGRSLVGRWLSMSRWSAHSWVYGCVRHRAPHTVGRRQRRRVGSVAVNVVTSIPLPCKQRTDQPGGQRYRIRGAGAAAQGQAEAEASKRPDPDAIPAQEPQRHEAALGQAAARRTSSASKQQDLPNQVYSAAGRPLVTPDVSAWPGGGGVGIGNNSPFGKQFGDYADLLRDKVAQ